MIAEDDMNRALDRIAQTPDGLLLYRYLQKRLLALPVGAEASALLVEHGARSFAADLMGRMARGIEAGSANAGSGSSERPVTFSVRGAISTGGQRGTRRRVFGDDPGGFDNPESATRS